MGLGQGGGKGDKAFLESCLDMEVGWSLRDGSAILGTSCAAQWDR